MDTTTFDGLPLGPAAVVSSKQTFKKQLRSYGLGALVAVMCSIVTLVIGMYILSYIPLSSVWFPHMLHVAIAGYCAVFVAYKIIYDGIGVHAQPACNTVATLFGFLVDWWLLPQGLSWWFPTYLGGGTHKEVPIGEQTIDYQSVERQITVIARDNFNVTVSLTVFGRIKYPLVYARFVEKNDPEEYIARMVLRNTRWYVRLHQSTDLPGMQRDASLFIMGKLLQVPYLDDEGNEQVKIFEEDEVSIAHMANEAGFEIMNIVVDDFNLPPEILDAEKRRKVQVIEKETSRLQAEGMDIGVRKLVETIQSICGADYKPTSSDVCKLMENVMINDRQGTFNVVRADGVDSILGAAALNASKDKQ